MKKKIFIILITLFLCTNVFANTDFEYFVDSQNMATITKYKGRAIELTIPELEKYSNFIEWVDVCKIQ